MCMVVLSSSGRCRSRRGGTIKVFACEWEPLLVDRASKRHADYCCIDERRLRAACSELPGYEAPTDD